MAAVRPAAPAPPDWSDLQYFVAVTANGSIARAALRLGVNHSTVLRRIAGLERHLGARLFDRVPGGYVPTALGDALSVDLASVAEQIDAAHRQMRGQGALLEGNLRIAASEVIYRSLLMPILAGLRRRHPHLAFALVRQTGSAPGREVDIVVQVAETQPAGWVGDAVGTLATALYAAPTYLQAFRVEKPLSEHAWVVPAATPTTARLQRWVDAHVDVSQVVLRVDSELAAAEAIAAGIGIGWLLVPLAQRYPSLQQIAPREPRLDQQLWVLTHPDTRHLARVREGMRVIAAAIRAAWDLPHDK